MSSHRCLIVVRTWYLMFNSQECWMEFTYATEYTYTLSNWFRFIGSAIYRCNFITEVLLPLESSGFHHTTWCTSCMSHSQTTPQLSVACVGRTWDRGHVTCVTELCTTTYEIVGLVPSSSHSLAGGLVLVSCHRHLSHLECKMSNEIAQLEVATSSKCKIATLSLFRGLQFLCRRENSMHQHSVLSSTGLRQIYLRANSGCLWFWVMERCGQLF